jgi:acetyltransferase
LVAERGDQGASEREIVAVARLIRLNVPTDAELAIVVSDPYQRKGLGMRLMEQLIHVARQEQIRRLIAYLHVDNRGMKRLCEQFHFSIKEEERNITATLKV